MKVACNNDEMINLVRQGDLEALDHMTACFGDRLLSVGRMVCGNSEDAQDVVQDALLSAGQNLQQFRGEGSLEGWLIRMVRNACYRMRRGRKNDPSLHVVDAALAADDDDPETLTGKGELALALGEAMAELSPEDRLILILAEGQDWTGPEIAERMELSPAAVRQRLARARKKVRTHLAAHL